MKNVELSKELTRLLMESYDRGVEDTKAAALEAVERAVSVALAAEREACAKVCDPYTHGQWFAAHIRARGENNAP